jgi:hypothetical protein
MADWGKELATLRLFNEKADTLQQSRFIRTLINECSGARFGWAKEGGDYAQRYGLDQEAIDAVTLLLVALPILALVRSHAMARETLVPDDLWAPIAPLLPPRPAP